MARAFLSLAVVAVCIGLSTAQLQICDPKKAPGEPWNTLLTRNAYDASSNTAKLSISWRSPVKSSSDGCLDAYRVEYYENGSKIGSQLTNQNAVTENVYWQGNAPAGKKLTIKVVALAKATGKESRPADVGTITSAKAPATAVPL